MAREKLDYEVMKPDQSEIRVKRSYASIVGRLIWNTKEHKYEFASESNVTYHELKEIINSMEKLNKKTILPRWLQWGSGN